MTRETKIGLLVGLAIILVMGIIISDHFSNANRPTLPPMSDFAPSAQRPVSTTPAVRQAGPNIGHAPIVAERPVSPSPVQPETGPAAAAAGHPVAPAPADAVLKTPEDLNPARKVEPTAVASDEYLKVQKVSSVPVQPNDPIQQLKNDLAAQNGQASGITGAGTAGTSGIQSPGQPQPPQAGAVHYVEQNQTLWVIAEKYYGSGKHWKVIAEANADKVDKNGTVKQGVRLVIPNFKPQTNATAKTPEAGKPLPAGNDPSKGKSPSPGKSATPAQPQPTEIAGKKPAAIGEAKVVAASYVVQPRDTLWSIAEKKLGGGSKHSQILAMNPDLHGDAGNIKPGMTLKMPMR